MNTTLTIDMTHLPNSIPLGRCGENHTVICFDCTSYLETYGEGSAALLFQPKAPCILSLWNRPVPLSLGASAHPTPPHPAPDCAS